MGIFAMPIIGQLKKKSVGKASAFESLEFRPKKKYLLKI